MSESKSTSKVVGYLARSLRSLLPQILAVLLAFGVAAIFIGAMEKNPLAAYLAILQGGLGSPFRISQTLLRATPLIIGSLGILFAYRVRAINVGGSGQLYFGAVVATSVILWLPQQLGIFQMVLASVAAMAGGGLIAGIVALLKVKVGANEVITAVMMNEIVIFFMEYLLYHDIPYGLKNPLTGSSQSPHLPQSALFPNLGFYQVNLGFIIALLLVPVTFIALEKTVFGYRSKIVGANPKAAKAAGINVGRNVAYGLVISGALMGLVGYNELCLYGFLQGGIGGLYGVTVLSVAALGKTAVGTLISGLFFGTLYAGSDYMQSVTGVPQFVTSVIDGLVLLFMLVSPILSKYLARKSET